eukprot:CAMPEP_0170544900 /NCGR_PEP_ID=MMETSP0211-20121228/3487_1 /TAXON_ID=311385 /ORGANISM="Pseudokeronopsis sp., Strain OXSARD2" /LENGTH=109 /DNA_ID=CAMNT_0010848663 /DNA_START=293 /DNA_END=622 /DNA_ORIENTATION=+
MAFDDGLDLTLQILLWLDPKEDQVDPQEQLIFFLKLVLFAQFLQAAPFFRIDVGEVDYLEPFGHLEELLVKVVIKFLPQLPDLVSQDLVLDLKVLAPVVRIFLQDKRIA